jgi:hypothetical protein
VKTRALLAAAMLVSSLAIVFEARPRTFEAGTTYETCFTPGQNCEGLIVAEIEAARRAIPLQALGTGDRRRHGNHRLVQLHARGAGTQRRECFCRPWRS